MTLEIFLGNNPKIVKEETDLLEPDSPTIPKISFSFSEYEILSITRFSFSYKRTKWIINLF